MSFPAFIKRAGVVAFVLVALASLAGVALHTSPARRYALSRIAGLLSTQGILFEAGALDYHLPTLRFRLDDASIRSKAAPDLPALARVKRIEVTLAWNDIIRGRNAVEQVSVNEAAIHYVADEKGRDNLPKPPGSSAQKQTWLIEVLKLDGGSLRIEDRPRKLDVFLPSWEISVDGDPASLEHAIRLKTLRPGSAAFEGRRLPLDDLSAAVQWKDDSAQIRALKLTSGASNLDVAGAISSLYGDPAFDLKLQSRLSLKPLFETAGIKPPAAGDANLVMDIQGPLSKWRATGNIQAANFSFDRFQNVRLSADASYVSGTDRLPISRFTVASRYANASGSGEIALAGAGRGSIQATLSSADLTPLCQTFEFPYSVASALQSDIRATWPGFDFAQADGAATIRLKGIREPAKDTVPLSGRMDLKARQGSITLSIESLTAMGATAGGQASLDGQQKLSGNLIANVESLASLQGGLSKFLGTAAWLTNLDGVTRATASLSGSLKQPQVEARISGGGIKAGELEGVALAANTAYSNQRIQVLDASLSFEDQKLRASGAFIFDGPAPTLDLTVRAENTSLATLLTGFGKRDWPWDATISATAGITGPARNPVVVARLSARGIQAYGESFGELDATARMDQGMVRVSSATLNKPDSGTLTASGSYVLDSKTFALEARARDFRLHGLTLPDGPTVRAGVDLDAKGSGSIDNPQLSAQFGIRALQIREIEAGELQARINVNGKRAEVDATSAQFGIAARADIGIDDPFPSKIVLKLDGTDLAKLPLKLDPPVIGRLRGTVSAEGVLKDWRKGTAQARLDPLDLRYREQRIQTKGPLEARYVNESIEIEPTTLVAMNSTVNLEGRIPLEETGPPGEVWLDGALDVPTLLSLIPEKPKVTAQGKLALGGAVRGSLKKLDPDVRLSLKNGSAAFADLQPFSGIEFDAVARGEELRLNRLTAGWASSRIEGEGVIPLASGQPGRLRMEMSGLDVSSIKGAPANVKGKVSIRLDAESSKADLQAVSGLLTFPELSLIVDKLPIRQQGVSSVVIKDGVASIKQFELRGPETVLRLSGTAGLQDPMPLNVRAEGSFDAGILASLAGNIRAQGPVSLELTAGGTMKQPAWGGYAEMRDGQLALPEFNASADNLNLRLEGEGDRIKIAKLSGSLNGGELSGGGGFRIDGAQLRDTGIKLRASNVYLSYPLGVKTLSTTELTLRSVEDRLRLGGAVLIHEGSYTDPLTLESGLLRYLQSGQSGTELAGERNPTLEKLTFDVGVHTLSPLVVDNNLAKAAVDMHLRLRGGYYRPGLTGRITVEEGGELYLNEKKYLVDLGAITFTNEQKIEPSLDIAARTRTGGYDISMKISGGGGEKIETTLTSAPSLPEPDIVALLLTGRTLDKIQGSEAAVAREQALSYLAGSVGGQLTGSLERATGLSQVRIEPNLIANESNPGARLTVGQDLTKDFRFIYSMNLANSSDQIYVAEYDVTRRFLARGIRQNDNTYRFEARHDLQFGGQAPPRPAAKTGRRVGEILFHGEKIFPDKQLADRFKIKPGKPFDFFEVRRGLDRLNHFYAGNGYLEARIQLKRQERGATVDLSLDIRAGPKVEFVFEGWDVAKAVRKRVTGIWRDGVFDTQRADEAGTEIRVALIRRDYLSANVTHSITQPEPRTKRVLFDIQPGVRFQNVKLVFSGAAGIRPELLADQIERRKLQAALYADPNRVTETLTSHYRERGYFNAKVELPRLELDPARRTGQVIIPIDEGPRFQAGSIRFAGNQAYSRAELETAIPLSAGKPFEPALQEQSVANLQDLYARKGYTAALIEPSLQADREKGVVDIEFRITENGQRVVAGIEVKGNSAVSANLAGSQLELTPGSPLDLSALSRSRRNLYTLGAFQVVEIDREEKSPGPRQPDSTVPVQLNVQLREVRPFEVKYGGYYDTERGPGGILDITNRNSLGNARVLGLRARYDSDLREARLYFSQPLLRRLPLRTVATTFTRREIQPAFITDRVGVTAQQEVQLWRNYILNYGYRLERVHTFEKEPDPIIPFDVTLRVAPLTASFTRETRDDILDASRGSLFSHSVEWAPGQLGSQLHFLRYFGQYFKYIPLSRPSEIPWSGGVQKSRLVYAGAVRAGLGGGLGGQDLVPSERFFSGGGTSIRGFRQDGIGPLGFRGNPVGGNAVLVLNNEIRFPLASIFDGVGFFDLGNVYPKAGDLSLGDVRKAAGAGLRIRTPYFLLRFDYGIKLGRKPGESFGQFFFSIGQAF